MAAEVVAPVIETVEAAAEVVAPVVSAGTLDYKTVAITAAGTLAFVGCAYFGYRAIKKRVDAKKKEPTKAMDCASQEPVEVPEP